MPTVDITSPDGCATWPVDFTICEDWAEYSPAVTGLAAAIAVSNLYYLTGAQFGQCETTFRPCHPPDYRIPTYQAGGVGSGTGYANSFNLSLLSSSHLTGTACSDCIAPTAKALDLPAFPVNEVTAMVEDNVAVDPSAFTILNKRTIIRRDGDAFPSTQDLTKATTETGTWSITVDHGRALPAFASSIVGYYACELAKNFEGIACALPDTAVSVTRAGITYEFASPEWIMRGLIGNNTIDTFILSVNPNRVTKRPTVQSPDTLDALPAIETWTGA